MAKMYNLDKELDKKFTMTESNRAKVDITVTDADDYVANSKDRLDLSKFKQLDRSNNGTTMCDQAFRDKLAKHYAFNVCSSWTDLEHKVFCFKCALNVDKIETITIPFSEAAEKFNVKSIVVEDNGNVILK